MTKERNVGQTWQTIILRQHFCSLREGDCVGRRVRNQPGADARCVGWIPSGGFECLAVDYNDRTRNPPTCRYFARSVFIAPSMLYSRLPERLTVPAVIQWRAWAEFESTRRHARRGSFCRSTFDVSLVSRIAGHGLTFFQSFVPCSAWARTCDIPGQFLRWRSTVWWRECGVGLPWRAGGLA